MSPVKEADPQAQALDAAFDEAMGAPAKPREPAAPPEVDADAPFGRGEDGQPKAPYGLTKDGKVRKSNAGRKASADDTPRTGPAQPDAAGAGKAGGAAAPEGRDYSVALNDFGDAVWFGASALGKGGSAIPLIGKFIPERKVAAQAMVFRSYKPNLVRAVNIAAQHNARAARFAASIEDGDITWVLMAGMMVMPFMTMSAAIWKDSEKNPALAQNGLPTVAELAEKNDKVLDAYLEQVSEQMEAMAEAQAAEALAAMNGQGDGQAAAPQVQEASL